MKKIMEITLEEIKKVAEFAYDNDGKLICTKLLTDIVGNLEGDHLGDQFCAWKILNRGIIYIYASNIGDFIKECKILNV